MNRGMVSIGEILGINLNLSKPKPEPAQEPEPVARIVAPMPKPPKVLGDPTRTPVNKQAAMMLSRPVPEPLPPEKPIEAELPRLRRENNKLAETNQHLVAENCALRRRVEMLEILLNKKSRSKQLTHHDIPPQPPSKQHQLLERLNGL